MPSTPLSTRDAQVCARRRRPTGSVGRRPSRASSRACAKRRDEAPRRSSHRPRTVLFAICDVRLNVPRRPRVGPATRCYSRRAGRPPGALLPILCRTLPLEEPTAPAVTDDPDHIWNAVQDELRQTVPADIYDIWLAPLRIVAVEGDVLVLEAPRELRAWVAERFARVLQ